MERMKTAKTKKSLKNMTKEQIREALQQKKEGNARALQIVEYFVDNVPSEDEFLGKLFDINQSHFQDAVEERAILNKCGYVLCGNMLGTIPKKQYHISTLQNRVFDITERKYFCSNNCFKSSNYIKDQVLTSPLWMRDTEKCPDFKLLTQLVRSCKDFTGNEIDLGHNRVKQSEIEKPEEKKDITTLEELMSDLDHAINMKLFGDSNKDKECGNSNAEHVNDSCADKENDAESINKSSESVKTVEVDNSDPKIPDKLVENTNDAKQDNIETIDLPEKCEEVAKENSTTPKNENKDVNSTQSTSKIGPKMNLVKEIVEIEVPSPILENKSLESTLSSANSRNNSEKENSDSSSMKLVEKSKSTQCDNSNKEKDAPSKSKPKHSNKEQDALSKARHKMLILESYMKQWISVDTLILLLGETAVQNVLLEANKQYKKHADTMRQLNSQPESNMNQLLGSNKQAYAKYTALCKKLHMLELAEEADDSQLTGRSSKPEQPVPNYEELKNQTEEMMIKVNEFYRGDKRSVTFADEEDKTKENKEEDNVVVMPAVDSHAQNALRRKILMDKLNKIVPEVLRLLGAPYLSTLSSDMRSLVRTFNLTAHNVMVNASEWSLVGLVLLKLLSSKDSTLQHVFNSEQSIKHVTLLCMSYGLDPGYLQRLHSWLLEPHHVIATTFS
ncbi:hypothetical protein WDU94_001688 [Cyamophila willieti]